MPGRKKSTDTALGREKKLESRIKTLKRELAQSHERQTASAEILRAIAGAPGDADSVLRTIAETASRLFDAYFVSVTRIDGEVFRQVALSGSTAAAQPFPLTGLRVD